MEGMSNLQAVTSARRIRGAHSYFSAAPKQTAAGPWYVLAVDQQGKPRGLWTVAAVDAWLVDALERIER